MLVDVDGWWCAIIREDAPPDEPDETIPAAAAARADSEDRRAMEAEDPLPPLLPLLVSEDSLPASFSPAKRNIELETLSGRKAQ